MDPVHDESDKDVTVKAQELVAVNLFPHQGQVQFFTRTSPLDVRAQETVISFDVIEGLYLSLLQMRLAARGQAIGLRPMGVAPTPY